MSRRPGLHALLIALSISLSAACPTLAQFSPTPLDPTVANTAGSAVAWSDYDGDMDLDFVIVGLGPGGQAQTLLRRQDAPGNFVDPGISLTGVTRATIVWGDYDNDGDLDFLLSGAVEIVDPIPETTPITRIYRNDAGVFVDANVTIAQVFNTSADWGDYDNDGDLDILLLGDDATFTPVSFVYRNDGGGSFTDVGAGLEDLSGASGSWGDYDGDGDLDILLTGFGATQPISRVYLNDGDSFFDTGASLTGVSSGDAAWGDYDADGDLDILLTGTDGTFMPVSLVYRNDGDIFTDIAAGLVGVAESAVGWGDYDNDGDLDILLTGWGLSGPVARLYRNDLGFFSDSGLVLGAVSPGDVAWGDYDGDGKLDFLLTGTGSLGEAVSTLYHNVGPIANTVPTTPDGLSVSWTGLTGTFQWNAASDLETPAAGLTYNLRVGTSPGGSEIISAMADATTGTRYLPESGNAGAGTSWSLTLAAGSEIYWSVQAIDGAFRGSGFATEQQSSVQTFTQVGVGVTPLYSPEVEWGDYDGDGDLDLLSAGLAPSGPVSRVHRNDFGVLTDIEAGLTGTHQGTADWVDYDNDGDLDVLLTGQDDMGTPVTLLYRNDGGSFVEVATSLPGLAQSAAAWGDCDNDGDPDLVLVGYDVSSVPVSKLYRNDAGVFVDMGAGLEPVSLASVEWRDIDADGDLDLALAGQSSTGPTTRIYENSSGVLSDRGDLLEGLSGAAMDFADFDNDGDPDLLVSGLNTGYAPATYVYRNDAGWFTDIGAPLPGVAYGASRWGDYDNDGQPDVLITGDTPVGGRTRVFRNDAGSFADAGAGLERVSSSSAVWGDFDDDGDLDIALAGSDSTGAAFFDVYRNLAPVSNQPPSSPTGLSATTDGSTITFRWDPATDVESPTPGLTYNLRVGTTPGGHEIMPAMASSAVHDFFLARDGNVGNATEWTLAIAPDQSYHWSVQTVDAGFVVSDFAPEVSTGAPMFIDVSIGLPDLTQASIAWGDYDEDDDLDLVLSGNAAGTPRTQLYRNDAGALTPVPTTLADVRRGSSAWGDYDNDGDLDLLLAGETGSGPITMLYRNDSGSFTALDVGLPGLIDASVAWGDSDNDGDLDIVITGNQSGSPYTRHYRNTDGVFTAYGTLTALINGSVAWGDYDKNGFRDLLFAGHNPGLINLTRVYGNSGTFSLAQAMPDGLYDGTAVWSDFDNDGWLDILLAGIDGSHLPVTRIYRSNSGFFEDSGIVLLGPNEIHSGGWWGDLDNDGLRDILTLGRISSAEATQMYKNEGANFVRFASGIDPFHGVAALADYDGDDDLDVLVAGTRGGGNSGPAAALFRNETVTRNAAPDPPSDLSASFAGSFSSQYEVRLSWGSGTDAQTPSEGLTYNLGARSEKDGTPLVTVMANELTGFRMTPRIGNMDHNREFVLTFPGPGHYSWSVQSVDASWIGSSFAPRESLWLQAWQTVTAGPLGTPGADVGASWADYDLDGDLDVYVTNGSFGSNRLLRNDDSAQAVFTDVTAPPLDYAGISEDAVWGDYDDDGDPDLYLVNNGPNKLFRNDGATFTEVVGSGLEDRTYDGLGGAWIDFDQDGLLDMAITNAQQGGFSRSRVYRNRGDGTFGPIVTITADVAIAWGDYDGDGDPDAYAMNVTGGNILYRNEHFFVEPVTPSALATIGPVTAATWGDYDGDEDMDLYVVVDGGANALFRNDGGAQFTEVIGSGLGDTGAGRWAAWGDSDNDGDLDLYLVNYNQANRLFVNEGGGQFGTGLGLGIGDEFEGSCAPWADVDDDGDLDLFLVNQGSENVLLRNDDVSANSWIKVDLIGFLSNLSGVGSHVRVIAGGTSQNRYVTAGTGIGGQSPITACFGLGAASVVDSVQVLWPSGAILTVTDVAVNQRLELEERNSATGVTAPDGHPRRFALHPATPNPFNPGTTIRFDLPRSAIVELHVYDLAGRRVRRLVRQEYPVGRHQIVWRGDDDRGRQVASGVYFYELKAGSFRRTQRVTLLK